ncbi:MAG: Fic family protein, partial [Leptolyngbyaceae cyanobacterium]
SFYLTPTIQKAISETDRHTTTPSLEWMSSQIGEQTYFECLLNDLIEDEAISSSQLEGAATTTKAAKEILKHQRKPRTPDERMIVGNFKMMKFAWENRNKSLSNDIILGLHQVGVEDIDNDKYRPGTFRASNDVEVVDERGNTVHSPPPFENLEKRLKSLCGWVNQDHHDVESKDYLHPLVKAITLHFSIGFEHPFYDGNGRVARALFYWYMFKHEFAAFRYIAISVLLKAAPAKYGRSYIFSESDEMDLTYFIDCQCGIISRAISEFKRSYTKALSDIETFNAWLWSSGLYKKLSDKQRIVFQVAKNGVAPAFTVANVQDNLGCSYNTAAKVLNGLVELKLFVKRKFGKTWVYAMRSKSKIQESWDS